MADHESIFPDPDILWSQIRDAERDAPEDRPVVLVVEDDSSCRMLIRYALRNLVRTDAASTAADALRRAEAVPYDGLLVDLRLPDGTGTEVVDDLRGRAPYWGVPMVAVTAYSLPDGSGSFLEAGFDAFVAKPFGLDDLRTLVRHLLFDSDEADDTGRPLVRREEARLTGPGTRADLTGPGEREDKNADREEHGDAPETTPLGSLRDR
jgi:CheY-like chemotaxis protein